MAVRIFTPQEAARTLPLVRQIVEDILGMGTELRGLWEKERLTPEESAHAAQIAAGLEGYYRELEQIGCSFRSQDFTVGLVDFPGVIDGQLVHLCWRDDEPELRYYHDPRAGFAGRKPIPAALLAQQ